MSERFMICKFQIHSATKVPLTHKKMADGSYQGDKMAVMVKMGAVWHGSNEAQAKSENAIFGEATPQGEFNATIANPALFEHLLANVGRQVYIEFSLADLAEASPA